MNKEDSELLREIHEVLVGTLDKPGFIEDTKNNFSKMSYRIKVLEKTKAVGVGAALTILTAYVGSFFV